MNDLRQSYCKQCKALIVFIRTENGKFMPCEANPVLYLENPKGESRVFTRYGKLVTCTIVGEGEEFTGIGYKPHWGGCISSEGRRRLEGYREQAKTPTKIPVPAPAMKAKPKQEEPKVEQMSLFTVFDTPYRHPM